MKLVGGDIKRFVVRLEHKELSMDELRVIFASLKGVEFSGIWSLAWFGYCPSELTMLEPKDVNYEKVKG